MCVSIKAPAPPPMPEPIPAPPPNTVSGAVTKQNAPASADASGRNVNVASAYQLNPQNTVYPSPFSFQSLYAYGIPK